MKHRFSLLSWAAVVAASFVLISCDDTSRSGEAHTNGANPKDHAVEGVKRVDPYPPSTDVKTEKSDGTVNEASPSPKAN